MTLPILQHIKNQAQLIPQPTNQSYVKHPSYLSVAGFLPIPVGLNGIELVQCETTCIENGCIPIPKPKTPHKIHKTHRKHFGETVLIILYSHLQHGLPPGFNMAKPSGPSRPQALDGRRIRLRRWKALQQRRALQEGAILTPSLGCIKGM